jgi:hypothetical protein
MIRYLLNFCLCPPDRLSGSAEKKWEKRHGTALKTLATKMTSWDWVADVTPPRTAAFLKWLKQARAEGARVNSPRLEEALVDDERVRLEWFHLDPKYEGALEILVWDPEDPVGDYQTRLRLPAYQMKPGIHVAGWSPLVYVSERFREVVEAHKLTGIEFVWCRDVGKFRAAQWYFPVCQQGLGRGLDHPWIDPKKIGGEDSDALGPGGRRVCCFRPGVQTRCPFPRASSKGIDGTAALDGAVEAPSRLEFLPALPAQVSPGHGLRRQQRAVWARAQPQGARHLEGKPTPHRR